MDKLTIEDITAIMAEINSGESSKKRCIAALKQLADTLREKEQLLNFINTMAYGQLPDGDIVPLPVVMHIEEFLDRLRNKDSDNE